MRSRVSRLLAPGGAATPKSGVRLRRGADLLPTGRRRGDFLNWLEHDLRERFDGRIIGIDTHIAHLWGSIIAAVDKSGGRIKAMDAFIAATAMAFDMTLVTRNTKAFSGMAVQIYDPWTYRK